jgi:dTDP-4-dehydrorhamnose 3,5-epimerase
MHYSRLEISDIVLCEPKVFLDNRGYFIETFRKDKFTEFLGYNVEFCQDNESMSTFGVIRGLHYQVAPHTQSKLVRVIKGRVLDVAVDIRKDSPTFGRHVAVELSDENKNQLFIPKGFANGFVVLSKEAIYAYKVDNYYNKDSERGIAYNDKVLDIDWKLSADELESSVKDMHLPLFKEAEYL